MPVPAKSELVRLVTNQVFGGTQGQTMVKFRTRRLAMTDQPFKRRIAREPGADARACLSPRLVAQAVMPRQPVQRQLQHDLGRSQRPAAFALDLLEAAQETAYVHQQSGKFRPAGFHCKPYPLPRCDDQVGHLAGAAATRCARAAGRTATRGSPR